jgi:guanine deaminase
VRPAGDFGLQGAVLYASCEPCPLCLAGVPWARVDRVLYAADRHDADRGGFDDLEFYRPFGTDRAEWKTDVAGGPFPGCTDPVQAWPAEADRVPF